MRTINSLSFVFVAAVALLTTACSPAGGPSANSEADQSVSTSNQQTQQWAREDLVSKSTSGNIQMPAPGLIVQALSTIQETTIPPDGVSFPEEVASAITGRDPPTDEELGKFVDQALFPKAATLRGLNLHFMTPKEFAEAVAKLAKTPDPAKAWTEREGAVVAAMTWKGVRAGDKKEVDEQMVHIRMALSAAAWCRTATQSTNGWPVNTHAFDPVPAWVRDKPKALAWVRGRTNAQVAKDKIAVSWYIGTTQQTMESCANLVAKIASSIGPIAYSDQSALQMAVYERLIAFTPAELEAMADRTAPTEWRIDMSGTKGQVFMSNDGRFENTGSGWIWMRGNVAYLDGSHVYGRAITVSLASAATGTMRQAITGNQSLAANAAEHAKAAIQVGPPK